MRIFLSVLLCSRALVALAQEPYNPRYPRDYFRNPLDIPIFLAGNFGECRPGHFHSGVDIKTQGKENQPVHAAADGYISRIKMDKAGFGHALYITHPNGYTTLYAHLNDFAPAIQKYLRKEQYEKRHWDVDVQLSPNQFPVKKGQQIAWSGNTGASTAPHLHFEIRNTATEHPLNPELFGLPIVDKTPPVVKELVIYTHLESFIALEKNDTAYQLARNTKNIGGIVNDTVTTDSRSVGVGLNVDDYMDGSDNTIAFYTAKLYFDDSLQAQITLDNIGYDETRYVNAYADYAVKQKDNKWIQRFFKLPGNHLDSIYSNLNNDNGSLVWHDEKLHKVHIVITDDKGNQSKLTFYVRGHDNPYINDLPYIGTKKKFFVNKPNFYTSDNISLSLDSRALYCDVDVYFQTTPKPGAFSDKYCVGDPIFPVHTYFDLKIKATKTIPTRLQNKIAMKYTDNKDEDGRAAAPADDGWYKARVRSFGTYWLDIDTTAPVITSLQKNNSNLGRAKQITFEVKDSLTSVKTFSGYLDGRWVCFEQHNDLFFYRFDEHCPKGKHKLVFTAEDENGNKGEYVLNFTR